jgi:hypothetical protein
MAGARHACCMFFLLTGNRFAALSSRPDRFSRYCFVLRQDTSKLVWDMLILKILDSHPDGQALTSQIAREVALLDSAAREIFRPSPLIEGGIFGAGFVTSPRKGVWRISSEGRQYVRSARGATGGKPDPLRPRPPAAASASAHMNEPIAGAANNDHSREGPQR